MKYVLILMLCAASVFANTAADDNGHDWEEMTYVEKSHIVLGWFYCSIAAWDAMNNRLYDEGLDTKENLEEVASRWYIDGFINDIVILMDELYESSRHRNVPIYIALSLATEQYTRWRKK